MHAYQRERSATAGFSAINHELNCLAQILHSAGLWKGIKSDYQPLRQVRRKRTPLTREQQAAIFRVASSQSRWKVAYWGSMLVGATGLRPGQVRDLTIGDIDLDNSQIRVLQHKRMTKAESLQRKISLVERWVPLNEAGQRAVRELLERAHVAGAIRPDHFLFPANANDGSQGGLDPTRHQRGWRRAWEQIRSAVGLPTVQMEDIRFSATARFLTAQASLNLHIPR